MKCTHRNIIEITLKNITIFYVLKFSNELLFLFFDLCSNEKIGLLIKSSIQSCLMDYPEILRALRAMMLLYASCSSFQGHVQ